MSKQTVIRKMARGHLRVGGEESALRMLREAAGPRRLTAEGRLLTAAGYRWEGRLFLYYECIGEEIEADGLFPELAGLLAPWPGEEQARNWVPMADVFHFNEPASLDHWLRKAPVDKRAGRVARLKPEMAASYIYYHYQLQEERAFPGPKFEIIGLHENVLFGYQEFPAVVERPEVPGRLRTSGTPVPWTDSRMDLHFQPWPDGHLYFKPAETLFAVYGGPAFDR